MEVFSEIRYKITPEDNEAEVSSRQEKKIGGVFVELDPKPPDKSSVCKFVKGLLAEQVQISN